VNERGQIRFLAVAAAAVVAAAFSSAGWPRALAPNTAATTSISTLAVTGIGLNTAMVQVRLSTTENGQWALEYGATTAYGRQLGQWGFSPEDVTMTFSFTKLIPGATYHYRAVARTPSFPPFTATYTSGDRSFTTKPAVRPAVRVTETFPTHDCRCATIRTGIFSGGLTVRFHLEYGVTAKLGQSAAAKTLPGPDASQNGGVVQDLQIPNLTQGKTYYYRVVAMNRVGHATTPVASFTMP